MTKPTYAEDVKFPIEVIVPTGIANRFSLGTRKYRIHNANQSIPGGFVSWMKAQELYADCFAPDKPQEPDDLTVLDGVGSGLASKLNEVGITTYQDFLDAGYLKLLSIKGMSDERITSGKEKCQELVG